jgi:hypothetical protein
LKLGPVAAAKTIAAPPVAMAVYAESAAAIRVV